MHNWVQLNTTERNKRTKETKIDTLKRLDLILIFLNCKSNCKSLSLSNQFYKKNLNAIRLTTYNLCSTEDCFNRSGSFEAKTGSFYRPCTNLTLQICLTRPVNFKTKAKGLNCFSVPCIWRLSPQY